jgi:proteic killer suppression protein
MIKSFRHKGVKHFFTTGSTSGIQAIHAAKLRRQLALLNVAKTAQEMNLPGWQLHALKGELKGHFALSVSGNWRLTFTFEGEDAVLVDYQDYH